ncbi:MAG: hypothetical protein PHX81_05150 [Eubacteriales bacterium]|nr:hypothetical protein [Eubacteriales bacterium]
MKRSGLVAKPVFDARTIPPLPPSRISRPLMPLVRFLAPFYLRLGLAFNDIELVRPQRFLEAVRAFQTGQTRLLVAFRHPYGDEPQLLLHAFQQVLPRLARRLGQPLPARPHLHMVHDYAVALWGGPLIRFILPRVGAVPVYHARTDTAGIRAIRDLLLNGAHPLALSPEGQISYHSEAAPRVEQGAVRMGLWCVKELAQAGRTERVQILPVSVHYRYDARAAGQLARMLRRLEKESGLPAHKDLNGQQLQVMQDVAERVDNRLLEICETFYTCPPPAGLTAQQRWERVVEAALGRSEAILGLADSGKDPIQRVYRVRQAGWDLIYPARADGTALGRALAQRRAGEAWLAMRHMELADLMAYHQVNYLRDPPLTGSAYDRLVETVLNLDDLVKRLRGGNISNRSNRIRKQARLVPGQMIDLTWHLADAGQDGRLAARQASEALRAQLTACMEGREDER